MKNIKIESEFIKLDQFLKLADIKVNSQVATQRGKKLVRGDIVTYMNDDYMVK